MAAEGLFLPLKAAILGRGEQGDSGAWERVWPWGISRCLEHLLATSWGGSGVASSRPPPGFAESQEFWDLEQREKPLSVSRQATPAPVPPGKDFPLFPAPASGIPGFPEPRACPHTCSFAKAKLGAGSSRSQALDGILEEFPGAKTPGMGGICTQGWGKGVWGFFFFWGGLSRAELPPQLP